MEKIYLFGLPVIFIGLMVYLFVATIRHESTSEVVRKFYVKLWLASVVLSTFYPLFFEGIKKFSLVSFFVFIFIILNEMKIRKLFLGKRLIN